MEATRAPVWGEAEADHRGQCACEGPAAQKCKRPQSDDGSCYCKKPEKPEKSKFKASKRKERMQIRDEINEIETVKKIHNPRSQVSFGGAQ